jgi:D-aspartate ligase
MGLLAKWSANSRLARRSLRRPGPGPYWGGGIISPHREKSEVVPAYVLGGHEAGLAVVRSLGSAGIPVVSVWHKQETEFARRSRHVIESVRGPHPWLEMDDFVAFLRDQPRNGDHPLLIPTTDETVIAVSRSKEMLQARYAVACPPWPVAELFIDKHRTYSLAEEHGIAAPRTMLPRSREEFLRGSVEFTGPCVLKPRMSHVYRDAFGVKMTKGSNAGELLGQWKRAEQADVGTLIQDFVPGPETAGVNYNAYVVDGEPVVEFTSRKLRLSPPDIGYPAVVVSEHVPEVREAGRRLLRAMGLSGFANVEFKRDARDGIYKLMEVNGRPNMSGLLAIRCGIDFPLMTYADLVFGTRPTRRHDADYAERIYWIHLTADLLRVAPRVRAGEISMSRFVKPYLRPHVFASLSARDPGPFSAQLVAKLRA